MATKAITRTRTRFVTRSRSRSRSRPAISLAILAGFAPTAAFAYDGFKIPGDQGGLVEAAHRVTMRLTGYEWKGQRWDAQQLAMGLLPLFAGALVHKMAGKTGINRMMKKATMGFITI